jgi:hypothetical protein
LNYFKIFYDYFLFFIHLFYFIVIFYRFIIFIFGLFHIVFIAKYFNLFGKKLIDIPRRGELELLPKGGRVEERQLLHRDHAVLAVLERAGGHTRSAVGATSRWVVQCRQPLAGVLFRGNHEPNLCSVA